MAVMVGRKPLDTARPTKVDPWGLIVISAIQVLLPDQSCPRASVGTGANPACNLSKVAIYSGHEGRPRHPGSRLNE